MIMVFNFCYGQNDSIKWGKRISSATGETIITIKEDIKKIDTINGVVVWIEKHLLVRADSCMIIITKNQPQKWVSGFTYYSINHNNKYEYYLPKLKMYIKEKSIVKFIKNEEEIQK